MNELHIPAATPLARTKKAYEPRVNVLHEPKGTEERLPFTVRLVRNEDDLAKAVQIRHIAYARHMPLFADALSTPEMDDTEDGAVILLAESKLDGSPLGTARIQTNRYRPLNMEQSIELPIWLKDQSIAEVRRLAVAPGNPGRLVKMILFKACFLYCQQNGLEWIVVAARPPVDRSYEKLLFRDVLAGKTFIPLPRENNVPHRVLGLEIETLKAHLTQTKHPLLNFFCYIQHPDIDVGSEVPGRPARTVVPENLPANAPASPLDR